MLTILKSRFKYTINESFIVIQKTWFSDSFRFLLLCVIELYWITENKISLNRITIYYNVHFVILICIRNETNLNSRNTETHNLHNMCGVDTMDISIPSIAMFVPMKGNRNQKHVNYNFKYVIVRYFWIPVEPPCGISLVSEVGYSGWASTWHIFIVRSGMCRLSSHVGYLCVRSGISLTS